MIVMLTAINELQRRFNDVLGWIGSRLADRGYARNPLVSKPTATTQVYRELAEEVAARIYPEIDEFEAASTYAIAPAWLHDMGRQGSIINFDVLPHRAPIYWNCIDDLEGKKLRETLLSPWAELVREHLIFL